MAEGQFSGPRSKYVYTDDTGKDYILRLDNTLAALSTTLTAFDPANPGTATKKPDGFKPRGVYWLATATGYEGRKKFIVCGDGTDTLYNTTIGATLTIDGIAGRTTGRRGEQLTF